MNKLEAETRIAHFVAEVADDLDKSAWATLRAVLHDYDALLAENEKLKKRLREEFAMSVNNAEEMREWKARAEKAEAQLAHAEPVLKAIRGLTIYTNPQDRYKSIDTDELSRLEVPILKFREEDKS